MAEFRTQIPAHAIERCAASIVYQPAVPDKIYQNIASKNERALFAAGFRSLGVPRGVSFDVMTGKMVQTEEGIPKVYVGPDGQTQITIAPNFINLQTPQYVRWAHFHNFLERFLKPICDAYNDVVSINAVKLEYWDRFLWTGDWSDFDAPSLLKMDSGFIASKAIESSREWHSHCGWFEYGDHSRCLLNINIDVLEGLENGVTPVPSVGIYTMMQEQVIDPTMQSQFESTPASQKLDELHVRLKKLFASLIVNEYATKIGLTGEAKSGA